MALLHLAHPKTFEPTVSADHKRWITDRFADVAGTSPDVDRRMLAVRAALTPQYGEGLRLVQRLAGAPVVEEREGLEGRSSHWLERSHGIATGLPRRPASSWKAATRRSSPTGSADIRRAWKLAGWGTEPEGVTLNYTRDRLLAFLDELSGIASGWDAPLRDRPEAYAAAQHLASLTERPPGWSDSEWEDLAGRLGLPPQPEPDARRGRGRHPPGAAR